MAIKLSDLSISDLNQLSCYNESSISIISFDRPSEKERDAKLAIVERNRKAIRIALHNKIWAIDDFDSRLVKNLLEL